jgi:hypothetical protein
MMGVRDAPDAVLKYPPPTGSALLIVPIIWVASNVTWC